MTKGKSPLWEHFEHAADIGIRGYGTTLDQAFEQCAIALTAVISDLETINATECLNVQCQAENVDFLLIDWLNELIYLMATKNMLFKSFNVHIDKFKLSANICGESINTTQHAPAVEIKGATFTELKVEKNNNGWMAQCVVDV